MFTFLVLHSLLSLNSIAVKITSAQKKMPLMLPPYWRKNVQSNCYIWCYLCPY